MLFRCCFPRRIIKPSYIELLPNTVIDSDIDKSPPPPIDKSPPWFFVSWETWPADKPLFISYSLKNP